MYPATKRALLKRVQKYALTGAGWIIRLAYRLLYHGKYPDFKADKYFVLTCSMRGTSRSLTSRTPETDARAKADGDALMKIISGQQGEFLPGVRPERPLFDDVSEYSFSLDGDAIPPFSSRPVEIIPPEPWELELAEKMKIPFRPEDIWQPPTA